MARAIQEADKASIDLLAFLLVDHCRPYQDRPEIVYSALAKAVCEIGRLREERIHQQFHRSLRHSQGEKHESA